MVVALTERGEAAAAELKRAITDVDETLATAFPEDELVRARRELGALVELHYERRAEDDTRAESPGPRDVPRKPRRS